MNSLYRYLTRSSVCLGFLIMISPGLGIGYDSASENLESTVSSEQPPDGGVKIIMLKIATESPDNQTQLSGMLPLLQPQPAKMQLQQTGGKRTQQSAYAKNQLQHAKSNRALKQSVDKHPSSDVTVPTNAPPPPAVQRIIETPEIQETIISEPLMPDDQIPLLTETHPQPFNDVDLSPVSQKNDGIQTAPKKITPEYAPQPDSVHDTVGIITRLLLKFSLITVCCIALYFSFSALQIAKSNQRAQYRVREENDAR